MSFKIQEKSSIKTFYSLLKSLSLNGDTCLLTFYHKELFFLQNLDFLKEPRPIGMTILYSFKSSFFSDLDEPKNLINGNLILEFPINGIFKHFNSMRKKLQSFTIEFPALLERSPLDLRQLFELEMELKYDCGISANEGMAFTVHKSVNTQIVRALDFNFLSAEIESFGNNSHWKRLLEFKIENLVNLSDFRSKELDFVMQGDHIICKQASILLEYLTYYLNIKKEKMIDYSNDVCLKDFEGRNRLTVECNKLLNYIQVCKDLKGNPQIRVSKKHSPENLHQILLPYKDEKFSCYYVFWCCLEHSGENDIIKNMYDPEEESMKLEIKEENDKEDLDESTEEIDFNEVDKVVEDINEKNRLIVIKSKENAMNSKEKSAFNYFSFLNEESQGKNEFNNPKAEKSKDFRDFDLENKDFKKVKSLENEIKDKSLTFSNNCPEKNNDTQGKIIHSLNFMNKSQFIDKEKNASFIKDPNYIKKNRDFFK